MKTKDKKETYTPANDSDRLNPAYLFSTTHMDLLVAISKGQIDPKELVKKELAARGLNENGEYIGFKRS